MQGSQQSPLDRVKEVLKAHPRAYVVVLFTYGLIVFPWLRAQGLQPVGAVIGVALLAGMFVVFTGNLERAQETLKRQNDDENERRGF
ncbi:hypothetical protein [Haloarchaeobius sp. DFWS5]|uniref:hypothetical protein n=1 Tax=Haloarchaeobius sp. DFWS5 TaxID=3446114 RepID=UPI003EBB0571